MKYLFGFILWCLGYATGYIDGKDANKPQPTTEQLMLKAAYESGEPLQSFRCLR